MPVLRKSSFKASVLISFLKQLFYLVASCTLRCFVTLAAALSCMHSLLAIQFREAASKNVFQQYLSGECGDMTIF